MNDVNTTNNDSIPHPNIIRPIPKINKLLASTPNVTINYPKTHVAFKNKIPNLSPNPSLMQPEKKGRIAFDKKYKVPISAKYT